MQYANAQPPLGENQTTRLIYRFTNAVSSIEQLKVSLAKLNVFLQVGRSIGQNDY